MKTFFLFFINFLIFANASASNLCDDFYEEIREQGKKLSLYEAYNDDIGLKSNEFSEIIPDSINLLYSKEEILYEIYFVFYNEYVKNGYILSNTYQSLKTKYNLSNEDIDKIIEFITKETPKQLGVQFNKDLEGNYLRDKNGFISIYTIEPSAKIELISNPNDNIDNFDYNFYDLKLKEINGKKINEISDNVFSKILSENNNFLFLILSNNNTYKINIEKSFIKPRVQLFPNLEILNINNIDEKNSSFEMSSVVMATWYDSRLKKIMKNLYENEFGSIDKKISNFLSNNGGNILNPQFVGGWWCELNSLEEIYDEDLFIWLPELEIINKSKANIINEIQTLKFLFTYYDDFDDIMEISFSKENDLNLNTSMNFKSYPFDKQKLDIYLALTEEYSNSVGLYPEEYFEVESYDFQNLFTWKINKEDFSYNFYKYKNLHDGLQITITAERNSNYFVYKILSPIFLILIVCWSVLFIHPKQIESRLTVSIVCFLTLIAYNFVIDQDLPKLGYLTLIDNIVLLSYIYSALPTIISIFEYKYSENLNILKLNNRIRFTGFASYILFFYIFLNISTSENTNINSFLKAITL